MLSKGLEKSWDTLQYLDNLPSQIFGTPFTNNRIPWRAIRKIYDRNHLPFLTIHCMWKAQTMYKGGRRKVNQAGRRFTLP